MQGQRGNKCGVLYLFTLNFLLTLQLGLQSEKGPKDKVN